MCVCVCVYIYQNTTINQKNTILKCNVDLALKAVALFPLYSS